MESVLAVSMMSGRFSELQGQKTVLGTIGIPQPVESWTNQVIVNLQDRSMSAWQEWLIDHPIASWWVTHPLWTLGLLVIAILLLGGLFGAVGRLTEGLWIRLFQAPLLLGRWIILSTFRLFRVTLFTKSPSPQTKQQKLNDLMQRLETLRQEQDRLMQEVRSLLAE